MTSQPSTRTTTACAPQARRRASNSHVSTRVGRRRVLSGWDRSAAGITQLPESLSCPNHSAERRGEQQPTLWSQLLTAPLAPQPRGPAGGAFIGLGVIAGLADGR